MMSRLYTSTGELVGAQPVSEKIKQEVFSAAKECWTNHDLDLLSKEQARKIRENITIESVSGDVINFSSLRSIDNQKLSNAQVCHALCQAKEPGERSLSAKDLYTLKEIACECVRIGLSDTETLAVIQFQVNILRNKVD